MSKSSKHKKRIRFRKKDDASASKNPQNASKIKKIAIISIIAAVLLIGILVVACNNKEEESIPNTPEAVAKEFMDAYCAYDAERMLPCYPDFIWANDESEKTRLIESLDDFLRNYVAIDKTSITYEITEIFTPTEEELLAEKEAIEGYAKIIEGFDLNKISEYRFANVVTYNKTYLAEEYTEEQTLVLINYDGEWCVLFPYFL